MPGLKKVYGALVGAVASTINTFLMGFGDLLLIAFAAAAPLKLSIFRLSGRESKFFNRGLLDRNRVDSPIESILTAFSALGAAETHSSMFSNRRRQLITSSEYDMCQAAIYFVLTEWA